MRHITEDCIEWDGALTHNGYGTSKRYEQRFGEVRVHRAVWVETHGPIPKGMQVLHRCDNPPCFLLDHLFLGTAADNSRDMVEKRRHAAHGEKKEQWRQNIIASKVDEKHWNKRLSWEDVCEIRKRGENYQHGDSEIIAKEFGISREHARDIRLGRRRKNK